MEKKVRGREFIYLLPVRTLNKIVNMAFLSLIAVLLLYGTYSLLDNKRIISKASSKVYEIYKPVEEVHSLGFDELRAINPDVVAWLTLYGTTVDYPIVYGNSNFDYLSKNALGEYSVTGSIYMNKDCSPDFSDFNTIVYGHNMVEKAMFGGLKDYMEKEYFESHKYGDLYYGDKHHGLEIIMMISCDASDKRVYAPGIKKEEVASYMAYLETLADQKRDIELSPEERILMMSTCANSKTNGRHILIAKIKDETYEDN